MQGFPHDLFALYMENDDALLRASHAAWMLVPAACALGRWSAGCLHTCQRGVAV